MVNQYYTPAQLNFVDQYIPIPFDQLMQIGKEMNARRDAAERLLRDTTKEWAKFSTMSDIDRAAYNARTFDRLQPLLDQFAADPNMIKTAAGQAALYNLINSTDYAALAQLQLGADAYVQREANKAKLKAAGKYNEDWDDVDMKNWDTLNNGVVDTSPMQYISLEELSTPYVSNLKPSYVVGNVNPNTGQKSPYTQGWMAITTDDLMNSLNPAMNDILSTPQGQKWLDTYRIKAARMKPELDNVQKESLARRLLYEAMIASQTDRLTETPVLDEVAIANAKADAKNSNTKKMLDEIAEDMISRMFPAQSNYSRSAFAANATEEDLKESQRLAELRKKYSKNKEIVDDSVSSEDAKATARAEIKEVEDNEDFEIDAIIQGVARNINNGIIADYYTTEVHTGKDKKTGKQLPAPDYNIRSVGGGPGAMAVNDWWHRTFDGSDDPSTKWNYDPEMARRDPKNFFLHDNEYNGGVFNTKTNKFKSNKPQLIFHTALTQLMTSTEHGESKNFEEYIFDDKPIEKDGLRLHDVKRERLVPPIQYLSEKDALLEKKAKEAGLKLSSLERQDYPLEQWIRSGKVSSIYVDGIHAFDFTKDLTENSQFEGLTNVYVPLSEVEEASPNWFGWGVESAMRDAGFEIKSDNTGKKYVIVPMVYKTPYTPQMRDYVNSMYLENTGMSSNYKDIATQIRNILSAKLGITHPLQQFGIEQQDLNYDGE